MAEFAGFVEADFKDTHVGTNWRQAAKLGGVLTQRLGQLAGVPYQSWPIYGRTDLFLYPADHFVAPDAQHGIKRGKLFVRAKSTGLSFGFYIEKGYTDGSPGRNPAEVMDESWDWPTFIKRLQGADLGSLVRNLVFLQNWLIGSESDSPGLYAGEPDGQLRHVAQPTSTNGRTETTTPWDGLVSQFASIPPDSWADFYLMRVMPSTTIRNTHGDN